VSNVQLPIQQVDHRSVSSETVHQFPLRRRIDPRLGRSSSGSDSQQNLELSRFSLEAVSNNLTSPPRLRVNPRLASNSSESSNTMQSHVQLHVEPLLEITRNLESPVQRHVEVNLNVNQRSSRSSIERRVDVLYQNKGVVQPRKISVSQTKDDIMTDFSTSSSHVVSETRASEFTAVPLGDAKDCIKTASHFSAMDQIS
jgi:hypothetical protein